MIGYRFSDRIVVLLVCALGLGACAREDDGSGTQAVRSNEGGAGDATVGALGHSRDARHDGGRAPSVSPCEVATADGGSHVHVSVRDEPNSLTFDHVSDSSGATTTTETITLPGVMTLAFTAVRRADGSSEVSVHMESTGHLVIDAHSSDGTNISGTADGHPFGPVNREGLQAALAAALAGTHLPAANHNRHDPAEVSRVMTSLSSQLANTLRHCAASGGEPGSGPGGDPPAQPPHVEFGPVNPLSGNYFLNVPEPVANACRSALESALNATIAATDGFVIAAAACAFLCGGSGPFVGLCAAGCWVAGGFAIAGAWIAYAFVQGNNTGNGSVCCPQMCNDNPRICCLGVGTSTCIGTGASAGCCDRPCGSDSSGSPLCCNDGETCFAHPTDRSPWCCPFRTCPLPDPPGGFAPRATCCATAQFNSCTTAGECIMAAQECIAPGNITIACAPGTTCNTATQSCCPAGATPCPGPRGPSGDEACCAPGTTCNPASGTCCAAGTHPFGGQCCSVDPVTCGGACCAAGGACDAAGTSCVYTCGVGGLVCPFPGSCNQDVPNQTPGIAPACCDGSALNNIGSPCAGAPGGYPDIPFHPDATVPQGCCGSGEVCPGNTNPGYIGPRCCGVDHYCPPVLSTGPHTECCTGTYGQLQGCCNSACCLPGRQCTSTSRPAPTACCCFPGQNTCPDASGARRCCSVADPTLCPSPSEPAFNAMCESTPCS